MKKFYKPFYGWIIVGVAFLIGITESSAAQFFLSVFMKPMIREFGWSRTALTGAMAFGSILAGLISPFVGPVLDRNGPRLVAFWSILILSAGLILTSFCSSIWQFYVFFGLGRIVSVGVLGLLVSVTISNWFIHKRGRALGITWLGPRLGAIFLPALSQFIILNFGWRMAWGALGIIIFGIAGIPSLIFLRRRPEDIGLLPDGGVLESGAARRDGASETKHPKPAGRGSEPVWTRTQALHTATFWLLTLIHSMFFFAGAGTAFHMFPFLTDNGMTGMTAVWVVSTVSASGALGSVVWGFLIERIRIQYLLAINGFASGLVFLLLFWVVDFKAPHAVGVVLIFVLAALHGIQMGGRFPVLENMWAFFFGRTSLGSIFSMASPFRFCANAVGPLFASFCFDVSSNYTFPFYFFCAIFLLAGTVGLFTKLPQHPLSECER